MSHIAVITSGGDAPGMNAAVRAVVRASHAGGFQISGFLNGYKGLMENRFTKLEMSSVANIIQRGGTVLKSGRCPEFMAPEGRAQAAKSLKAEKVDHLICIGGDGSFRGAQALFDEHKIPWIGVPGTIDNDISGTEKTIGFDTAVNTAVEAIDRIRDTAASHDRLFIVEVMGRDCGQIAVEVALAGGAEDLFIPEYPNRVDEAISRIQKGMSRGKTSSILIAAEGQKPGRAYDLGEQIRKKTGMDAKVCVLGHIQRGGRPSAFDRILASRMGAASIAGVQQSLTGVMTGLVAGQIEWVELKELTQKKKMKPQLIDLARHLA